MATVQRSPIGTLPLAPPAGLCPCPRPSGPARLRQPVLPREDGSILPVAGSHHAVVYRSLSTDATPRRMDLLPRSATGPAPTTTLARPAGPWHLNSSWTIAGPIANRVLLEAPDPVCPVHSRLPLPAIIEQACADSGNVLVAGERRAEHPTPQESAIRSQRRPIVQDVTQCEGSRLGRSAKRS